MRCRLSKTMCVVYSASRHKEGWREELGRELLDKAGNESLLHTWALCHSLAPFPPEYALERTPHWIGHIHTRVTVLF